MRIFVSIASYCDPMLKFTVDYAIQNAKHPENLHFGVVDQSPQDQPRLKLKAGSLAKLSYVRLAPKDSRGACWARSIAMTMYTGEDWFFQIDSHTYLEPNWDEVLISWATKLAEGRRKIVISSYPENFTVEDKKLIYKPFDGVLVQVTKKTSAFNGDDLRLALEATPIAKDTAVPGFLVAGGCLFTHGQIVYEVPYDPFFYFHGEEQSLALRLFTKGWDIFHIPKLPVYHMYHSGKENKRPLHWDADQDEARSTKWHELEDASKKRFKCLIEKKQMGVYGLGTYRTLEDYALYSGIDYINKCVEDRAHNGKVQ